MIATLRGTVQTVSSEHAVIEVGGVGYLVRMTGKDIAKFSAGQEIFVFTHLSVSQDSMTLYGFSNFEEQKIFLSLQKMQEKLFNGFILVILRQLSPRMARQ